MLEEEPFQTCIITYSGRFWCSGPELWAPTGRQVQVGAWQGIDRDIEREAEVSKAAPPLPPAATSQGWTGEMPAEAPP